MRFAHSETEISETRAWWWESGLLLTEVIAPQRDPRLQLQRRPGEEVGKVTIQQVVFFNLSSDIL